MAQRQLGQRRAMPRCRGAAAIRRGDGDGEDDAENLTVLAEGDVSSGQVEFHSGNYRLRIVGRNE